MLTFDEYLDRSHKNRLSFSEWSEQYVAPIQAEVKRKELATTNNQGALYLLNGDDQDV